MLQDSWTYALRRLFIVDSTCHHRSKEAEIEGHYVIDENLLIYSYVLEHISQDNLFFLLLNETV